MSQIYDNWERLVRVVLRREEDKRIALSPTWDSSSSSSSLSSFDDLSITSTFQVDHYRSLVIHERTQVPMDYSDLTLDHHQWKTMLPPHQQQVVLKSASMSFFLDPRTGKNCFLLGSAKLTLSKGEAFEHFWGSYSHSKSRFAEVAKLKVEHPSHVYVKGSIETKMLSPETLYAAYFVFAFIDSDRYRKHISVDSSIRISYDESHNDRSELQVRINLKPSIGGRPDGWKEIELGDFFVGEGDNAAVVVQLHDPVFNYSKSCLIMEGIEFRPFKGKRKITGRRILLKTLADL